MNIDTIRKNIRIIREDLGLSQEDMAVRLGLSRNGYCNIEKGPTILINRILPRIADMGGWTMEELLDTDQKGGMLREDNSEEKLRSLRNDYENRLAEKNALILAKEDIIRRLSDEVEFNRQLITRLQTQSEKNAESATQK